MVLTEGSAKDVLESIVVVVAHANAARPTCLRQARFFRDIGESAIAIVLVEAVGCTGRIPRETRTGEQKNIHPTVVVVVNEGTATTSRFQNVFLAFHAAVDHGSLQSRSRRHISEMSMEGTSRRCWARRGFDCVWCNPLRQESRSGGESRGTERKSHKRSASKGQGSF